MVDIVIDEVTTGALEGSGAFDEIMQVTQLRLQEEYAGNRIKGSEYSKVYLGGMQQAMQQAIAFVLGRQTASAQADLTILQGELIEIEKANAAKQGELIDQQILKMIAEVGVLEKELIIMDSNILVAEQQVLKSAQEVENLAAQLPQIKAQTSNILEDTKLKTQQVINAQKEVEKSTEEILVLKQEVLLKEQQVLSMIKTNEKIDQEIKVMVQQVYSAEAQISDTYGPNNTSIAGLMGKQIDKMKKEGELLEYKGWTERSQVLDIIEGTQVAGTVGKQKGVYQAQIDGFSRKAEQDMAKIMTDSYNVRRSTNEAEENPPSLSDPNIDKVVYKAGLGIGVTLEYPT